MGNFVDSLEDSRVFPFFEVLNAGEDIGKTFLISKRYISIEDFVGQYRDIPKSVWDNLEFYGDKISPREAAKNEIIPPNTLDHAVIVRRGLLGQRNIMGIYVMNRVPSLARLGIQLKELAHTSPELAPYFEYFVTHLNDFLAA